MRRFIELLAAASLTVASPLLERSGAPNQIVIDARQTFQHVDGFGFSEAFQRSNWLHGKLGLSPTNQTRTLDLLFSDKVGAGLTILRNGIGSSPNSDQDFMMSIEPVSPGSPNAKPNYVWDNNDNSEVWLSQQALSYGVKTIYADAWSAPGYMKTNNTDIFGGYLCGVTGKSCPSGDWRQAFANYLVKYLQLYKEAGIDITHVGFLNEPDLSTPYASMLSDGTQAADFLKILAPTLKKAGLKTKICCCDATGWRQQQDILTELQQAGAEDIISVVTSHGYQSEPGLPFSTDKPVWQTEWADLGGAWTPAWDDIGQVGEGIQWANKIQECFTISNCSAFIYWIGAEPGSSNSMLIRINGDSVEPSARLWAFAGFSRFVKPGALRIGATSENQVLHVSAFLDVDGTVALQVINNGYVHSKAPISLVGRKSQNVHVWLTDSQHDLDQVSVQDLAGQSLDWDIPPRSLVNFVFPSTVRQ